jgi:hypothetical protein
VDEDWDELGPYEREIKEIQARDAENNENQRQRCNTDARREYRERNVAAVLYSNKQASVRRAGRL